MNGPKSKENTANRRAFLKTGAVAAGAATLGGALLASSPRAFGEETSGHLTRGDASILRFLAATHSSRTSFALLPLRIAASRSIT